ncbi:MAG TPA: AAA family ATPase [Planctomycetaceae bacterium]|nr:AAA family ATPase [Planctomycetaceae bacterium]HQZ69326.1 AAA family ATPase [Planctomycetaceae bacterium]
MPSSPEPAAPTIDLPAWFPQWANDLAQQYFSGTACFFVIHGNVHDLIPVPKDGGFEFLSLSEFLGEHLFAKWDLVLEHNLSQGLQALAGSKPERHQKMMQQLTDLFGPYRNWSRDSDDILLTLDQMIERTLVEDDPKKRLRMAVIFDFGQYLVPPGDAAQIAGRVASRVVRFLDWARNPWIRRVNMAFCVISEGLSEINERLTSSPFVATIEIPMPDANARRSFITERFRTNSTKGAPPADVMNADQLAASSNGLSLLSLDHLIALASRSGGVTVRQFQELKKNAIERQCGGYLEFVEPKHKLDLVVGLEAAVKRLRDDAKLITDGHQEAAPMGYLICGPVGTGKSFLAECYAGSIGIPCVKLRNFRSKYVGETEGNLQRVLTVLRSLGPVVVIIDEADASLGDRNQDGDSGTSGRVFSMIAQQMGDTRFRGRIIWMLLTCRPDLLPIDLKRQGRAEVHIPLFYPHSEEDIRMMFGVMGRKNGIKLDGSTLTLSERHKTLSGADIESVVLTARRYALIAGRNEVTQDDIAQALGEFIPSAQGIEKDMQEAAAVLECTQLDFLTPEWRERLNASNGRSQLQQRFTQMRAMVERM